MTGPPSADGERQDICRCPAGQCHGTGLERAGVTCRRELARERRDRAGVFRTVVHVDEVFEFPRASGERWMRCTPGGVPLPEGSVLMPVSDLPETLRESVRAGKVFFAAVNLAARRSQEVTVEMIEDQWGVTDSLLHWEQ